MNINDEIQIGYDVLGSVRNTNNGVVSIQLGDSTGGEVRSDNAEWWQHVGFVSRPSSPVAGKPACQVISLERTDRDICIASRDVRYSTTYGTLSPGETALYASGPNGTGTNRLLLKDSGSIASQTMLCQAGNSSSGNPVLIQISSDDGGKINIAAGSNGAITLDSTGIKFATPGKIQLGSSGELTLIGQTLALNGSSVSLGAGAVVGVGNVALAPNLLIDLAAIHAFIATATAAFAAPPLSVLLAASGLAAPVVTAGGVVAGLTATLPLIQSTSVIAAQ